jgi:hypothetical protein
MELVVVNDNETNCCVCLETYVDTEPENWIKMNCCQQYLHKNCLAQWILCKKSKRSCPICRQQVKLNEYMVLQELLISIRLMVGINKQHVNNILKDDFDAVVPETFQIQNCIKIILALLLISTVLFGVYKQL